MSLIRNKQFIPLCCAATILDLDESTIRLKKCGTENLTHIRRGKGKRQRISLIHEEVVALRTRWIEDALKKQNKLSGNSRDGILKLAA